MTILTVNGPRLVEGIERAYRQVRENNKHQYDRWNFHDDLYRELEARRRGGLTEVFWCHLIRRLNDWKAIRGIAEVDSDLIRERGIERLSEFATCYDTLTQGRTGTLSVDNLTWEDVNPLFEIANSLKWGDLSDKPSTFASKLCHFLVPAAYFVCDQKLVAMSAMRYGDYWSKCKAAWMQVDGPTREVLVHRLQIMMKPEGYVASSSYPWATKITELCQFKE